MISRPFPHFPLFPKKTEVKGEKSKVSIEMPNDKGAQGSEYYFKECDVTMDSHASSSLGLLIVLNSSLDLRCRDTIAACTGNVYINYDPRSQSIFIPDDPSRLTHKITCDDTAFPGDVSVQNWPGTNVCTFELLVYHTQSMAIGCKGYHPCAMSNS